MIDIPPERKLIALFAGDGSHKSLKIPTIWLPMNELPATIIYNFGVYMRRMLITEQEKLAEPDAEAHYFLTSYLSLPTDYDGSDEAIQRAMTLLQPSVEIKP